MGAGSPRSGEAERTFFDKKVSWGTSLRGTIRPRRPFRKWGQMRVRDHRSGEAQILFVVVGASGRPESPASLEAYRIGSRIRNHVSGEIENHEESLGTALKSGGKPRNS